MDSEKNSFRIVMFPWLAHGHIFPFLELAKRISNKYNFHIHLCPTAINFSSVTQFIQKNSLETSIQLEELRLDPNPLLPPHYQTTKNLPPNLILALLTAFQTAKSSFSAIISALKPDLVIFDAFQPWAASLATSLAIPAVFFSVVGAAATSYSYHHYISSDHDDFPFPELRLERLEKKSLDDLVEFLRDNVFYRSEDSFFLNFKLTSEAVLMRTSRGLEGKYIDYISSMGRKRILAVGPLVADADQPDDVESTEILQWLSKKDERSTVYISFGSEYFLSKEEIEEMAKGLELCGVNFIWVIRFPKTEKAVAAEEVLPQGFLVRVGERGIVVTGWAPQAGILAHGSIGGFLSHCG